MTHCNCGEWKKEERKRKEKKEKNIDYITIGIIYISQYTHYSAISREFSGGWGGVGGGGTVLFLVYWHLKPCHGWGWGAENFAFYEGLKCWKQPFLEEIKSNWLSW